MNPSSSVRQRALHQPANKIAKDRDLSAGITIGALQVKARHETPLLTKCGAHWTPVRGAPISCGSPR